MTVILTAVAWFSVRAPSAPVGYFTSAAGRDRFGSAYAEAMGAMPRPEATLDIRTGYGIVRVYRFAGAEPEKPPLLLLPGWGSASPVWADNLPSLLSLRTVYTVDLLGEPGASVQDRPIETSDDQANWLHETLTALPEPRLVLVGLSIGGWTAMNLAVRRPEKVAGTILLDPVFTFTAISTGAVIRTIPLAVRWAPRSWRDSFNSWTANGAPVEDVPVADMIESGMRDYVRRLPAPDRFSTRQLGEVRAPVLVIFAGATVMHDPVEGARVARESLPQATVLTYEGASHAVNGEAADRIATDAGRFLSTIG
ncbi:alpha/beta hydrolase [Actinoplanes sp. NEAU-A12]|uniref:Alpha/beta hydrolase n=1 Tax=Actinoplanes sandaracinus TaxID=3045177 RepID=A0ABT6X172_9ACTN|nr:alpha/beta hydrolase [Actinoplanes sandaracinus]MDI6105762.1 alpha/beta hydrolase [Actinoplanes sandaracinus]